MFVHLGGDESTKPTYFEVIAADRLVPSLKAAVVYALSVFSQRHPWVHRLLNYEDEVFALVTLALDGHSLLSSDSTFADSLYGLKRRPLLSGPNAPDRLSRRQRFLILACQVLLPYLRAKADKAYRRHSSGAGLLGLALRYSAEQRPSSDGGHGTQASASAPGSWSQQLRRGLVATYPWLHAAVEGVTLAYHLTYMLGASPVHHPALHAVGVTMARISGKDLADADRAKQAARQATLTALLGTATAAATASGGAGAAAALLPGTAAMPPASSSLPGATLDRTSSAVSPSRPGPQAAAGPNSSWRRGSAASIGSAARRGLVRGLLGARWFVEDHARSALILAVFGFKALEWWYTTAEDSLARSKVLPPPPPPPPPRPAPPPLGVGLPADPSDCPVCRKRTTNPAAVATSGYVFCYPCAFNYIMEHGRCPVSALPASLDHVRKLYEAA